MQKEHLLHHQYPKWIGDIRHCITDKMDSNVDLRAQFLWCLIPGLVKNGVKHCLNMLNQRVVLLN